MKFHTRDAHQHGRRLICINVWRQLQIESWKMMWKKITQTLQRVPEFSPTYNLFFLFLIDQVSILSIRQMFAILFWRKMFVQFFIRFHQSLKPSCLCLQRYKLLHSRWLCVADGLQFPYFSAGVIWFIQVWKVLEVFEGKYTITDSWFLGYPVQNHLHYTTLIIQNIQLLIYNKRLNFV